MSNTSDTPPSYKCKDFEDIAKCFEKLHLHINNEVEILKTKQTETERRVDNIENHNEFMNSELHAIHNTHIPNLESLIEKEQTERLKLEIWGRKWNVVIRGVQGNPNHQELPKVTETFTRVFLKNTVVNVRKVIATTRFVTGTSVSIYCATSQNISGAQTTHLW
ncbi:Hypothetical predicted protein [Mytilus galloprovincialis]|uniref:Uncharacterized protein n=1 Tax=Mytilus galloprovincialis TaxID=29158 RepID=A0A8B6DP78_MYTGA|nr:Hypothetical predicted protein [Mytilus galloprovincialis]